MLRTCICLISLLILGSTPFRSAEIDKAQELIQKVRTELGDKAFESWTDYYGEGRMFILKRGGQSWTKFWEYYKWSGKSRTAYNDKDLYDVYNLDLGKGWAFEYGKVKAKTEEDVRRFRQSEKRNLFNLFRDRYREPGMKVFYLGPENIDSLKPMEALEFVDADNFSFIVYFEEGNPVPQKVEYKDRNPDGLTINKTERFYRWFRVDGILSPKRVEFYTGENQTGLVEYSLFRYNTGLSDTLFQEPVPVVKK